jgi:peptide/nickel transport system permease protein
VTRYLVRRVAQAIVVLVLVSMIVFGILHFLPGSPARAMLGVKATPGAIKAFNKANGYTRALPMQYLLYVDHLLHGNLGFSYIRDQSVASLLALDLPKTALLVGVAYALALVIAIPVGLVQALKRNSALDHAFTLLALIGYSMPLFWLGMILIVIFAVQSFHVLPAQAGTAASSVGAVVANPQVLVLPVAALTIVTVAQFSRFMRASAIDNLLQDYVRTARAKGASQRQLVTRHLLRNSLLPIVTLIGLSLPAVLSGAVIIEALFNYPGMGWLFWQAASAHDYPVLMGFTIVVAAATVVGSLVADVGYAFLDPRIRYSAQ